MSIVVYVHCVWKINFCHCKSSKKSYSYIYKHFNPCFSFNILSLWLPISNLQKWFGSKDPTADWLTGKNYFVMFDFFLFFKKKSCTNLIVTSPWKQNWSPFSYWLFHFIFFVNIHPIALAPRGPGLERCELSVRTTHVETVICPKTFFHYICFSEHPKIC